MVNKSDKRISATEASRSFSQLLNEVERGGRFLIQRRGEDICAMIPPPLHGRRASECLKLLRSRSSVTLDEEFGVDLLQIVTGEVIEERPTWDS